MKSIITKKRYIAIMIAGLMIISLIIVPTYNNRNVSNIDKHDWEVVDSWINNGYAYDSQGNLIKHYYCTWDHTDLSLLMEQKPWLKDDCGKGYNYWSDANWPVDYDCFARAQKYHRLKNPNCYGGYETDNVDVKYTIPKCYRCKECGCTYSEPNGLLAIYCTDYDEDEKVYDANRNYIGNYESKMDGVNLYCLEHGLPPKYFVDSDWAGSCDYKESDTDKKNENIVNGDKVYDKNGKLITGPKLVTVREKSSYIQVFVKSDGTILKSAYFECNGYLYNSDSFGGVSLKLTTLAITYNNKLYSSDGAGKATLIKNKTVTINGYAYTSDENGNVTNNTGGSSPGQSNDGSWQNDPVNNPSGSGYKKEYRNGIWYDSNGKADSTYRNGQWKQDSAGWWFEDNGWYPTSSWLKIDGKYYYFCADGYMDYSEYREGCWLNDDGSWDTAYAGGHWTQNSTGWWYEDNGWFPASEYLWVDGVRYWFNGNGYWE